MALAAPVALADPAGPEDRADRPSSTAFDLLLQVLLGDAPVLDVLAGDDFAATATLAPAITAANTAATIILVRCIDPPWGSVTPATLRLAVGDLVHPSRRARCVNGTGAVAALAAIDMMRSAEARFGKRGLARVPLVRGRVVVGAPERMGGSDEEVRPRVGAAGGDRGNRAAGDGDGEVLDQVRRPAAAGAGWFDAKAHGVNCPTAQRSRTSGCTKARGIHRSRGDGSASSTLAASRSGSSTAVATPECSSSSRSAHNELGAVFSSRFANRRRSAGAR